MNAPGPRDTAAQQALIQITDVAIGYQRTVIVSGITMAMHAGECWCVVGRNGAGKSTFLATLVGMLPPLAGTLLQHPRLANGRAVGYVPQRGEVRPHIPTTVREFVSLGLVGTGITATSAVVMQALARVGLEDHAMTSFVTLSGGQRQRALLARAFIRQPAILIVDEPTAGLDVPAQDALANVLKQFIHRDGVAVLLVTHETELVAQLATHTLTLRDGRATTQIIAANSFAMVTN